MTPTLSIEHIEKFRVQLIKEEKSDATIEKYIRDANRFYNFSVGLPITKELIISYKRYLMKHGYKDKSINSMLASVNHLLGFIGCEYCKVKNIRTQKKIYCSDETLLTKDEYLRLIYAAENNIRLSLIIQTICSTGIRISELKYFTVESIKCGEITVNCKGKIRPIIVPLALRKKLLEYISLNAIITGPVFITKNGNHIDRSNIWKQMKNLCHKACVAEEKVFPHNLRKLFARTFYSQEKDIAVLADILGHSSINTTRIYIMTTGAEHRNKIDMLNLVV